jgi:hypothetical protein
MAIKDWVTCEVEGCTLPIVGANNQGAGQGWDPKTFSASAHSAMMISDQLQLTKHQFGSMRRASPPDWKTSINGTTEELGRFQQEVQEEQARAAEEGLNERP